MSGDHRPFVPRHLRHATIDPATGVMFAHPADAEGIDTTYLTAAGQAQAMAEAERASPHYAERRLLDHREPKRLTIKRRAPRRTDPLLPYGDPTGDAAARIVDAERRRLGVGAGS